MLLSAKEEGMLLQKYRDRSGRCIAILFKSIGVRGRFDSCAITLRDRKSLGYGTSLGDDIGQASSLLRKFGAMPPLLKSAWSTVGHGVRDQLGPSWSQEGQLGPTCPRWSPFCCVLSSW